MCSGLQVVRSAFPDEVRNSFPFLPARFLAESPLVGVALPAVAKHEARAAPLQGLLYCNIEQVSGLCPCFGAVPPRKFRRHSLLEQDGSDSSRISGAGFSYGYVGFHALLFSADVKKDTGTVCFSGNIRKHGKKTLFRQLAMHGFPFRGIGFPYVAEMDFTSH